MKPRWLLAGIGTLLVGGGIMAIAATSHHRNGSGKAADYAPGVGITAVGMASLIGAAVLKDDDDS